MSNRPGLKEPLTAIQHMLLTYVMPRERVPIYELHVYLYGNGASDGYTFRQKQQRIAAHISRLNAKLVAARVVPVKGKNSYQYQPE